MIEGVGKTPDIICDLHAQVESFKRKLEVCQCWLKPIKIRHVDPFRCFCAFLRQSVAHLSWMGLFREDADQHLAKFSPQPGAPQLSMEEEHQLVHTKFLNMRCLKGGFFATI